jgi:sensitive to high expression protein 9
VYAERCVSGPGDQDSINEGSSAMLRRPFSRPFLLRQFSTFSPVWNAQRPIQVNTNKEEKATEPQNTHIPPTTVTEDVRTKSPLPTHSDARSSSKPGPSVTPEPLTAYDIDLVKQRIRSWTEQAAIALRNKADDFTASSKVTFSQLGSELNRVTGYEEIEVLKRGIVAQGMHNFDPLHYKMY